MADNTRRDLIRASIYQGAEKAIRFGAKSAASALIVYLYVFEAVPDVGCEEIEAEISSICAGSQLFARLAGTSDAASPTPLGMARPAS
ncbi:hypothetical protein ABIE65_005429 [Constrictibacter sp. MBR-5]|jgi:hypothetical protein|uniref:hypothetical protein n=1 Tax=Constrictibacter sp. MBR-5 TaxID=3156467 RepID=UPI003396906A